MNICCLNPLSHRMLHHADYKEIKDVIVRLCEPRADFLTTIGLVADDVLEFYS
jgi:hypothetical protein